MFNTHLRIHKLLNVQCISNLKCDVLQNQLALNHILYKLGWANRRLN